MEERVEFTFTLLRLESYHIGKRSIRVHGQFTKKTRDTYGSSQKKPFTKTLWLPRTFPIDQEQALLYFLQNQAAKMSLEPPCPIFGGCGLSLKNDLP